MPNAPSYGRCEARIFYIAAHFSETLLDVVTHRASSISLDIKKVSWFARQLGWFVCVVLLRTLRATISFYVKSVGRRGRS